MSEPFLVRGDHLLFKTIRRYSVVSILIISCFLSAFIALFNGVTTSLQTNQLIKLQNKYSYLNEVRVSISFSQPITLSELIKLVDGVSSSNIMLNNMTIYFDQINSVYRPQVILVHNEPLSIPSSKELSDLPDQTIVASKSVLNNNNYLSVNGVDYTIFNTLDDTSYPFTKGLFILNGVDYFKAFPDATNDIQQIELTIASNKDNVYSAYTKIKDNLKYLNVQSQIFNSDIQTQTSVFQSMLNQENLLAIGLFIFALLNTSIISYYWITVRRYEIAVRKAFGHTNTSIAKLLFFELLNLITFAAITCLAIQFSLSFFQSSALNISEYLLLFSIFVIAIFITIIISMIVPLKYILKIQPSEGVKS